MIIAGLDIATTSGIAILDCSIDAITVSYADDIKAKVVKGKSSVEKDKARQSDIVNGVHDVVYKYRPDLVVIENYSFGSLGKKNVIYELGGVVKFFLLEWGVHIVLVEPRRLKKFVTGSGNAKKDLMMLEVFRQFGVYTKSDNVADAVGLAYFGAGLMGYDLNIPDINKEALKGVELPSGVNATK